MKKNILKLLLVAGLIAVNADLRAFTAVASGAWSSAATWGGVGPGASVTGQDIIIPSGITVDMDVDVTFNGTLNSFWVTGALVSSANNDLTMVAGTLTGSGTIDIRKLTMGLVSSFLSYTGAITLDVLRNEGTVMNLMAPVTISDTLDLEAGAVIMGGGSSLQLLGNSDVRVNSGVLVNNGGTFITGAPYDVTYVGITKITSEEVNSASVRDVNLMLTSNAEDVILNNTVAVNGTLYMVSGHIDLNGQRLRVLGDLSSNPGSVFESSVAGSDLVVGGYGTLNSDLHFSSGTALDELIISRDTMDVHLATELMIGNRLTLEEGYLVIDAPANLVMNNGSWITVVNGEMINNGAFDGTQTYNVEYIGGSHTTGPELSGSGLNDLTMFLFTGNTMITLSQDVTIPGNFILAEGNFALDTFTLELQGGFHQADSTAIWGTSMATLIMSMASAPNDTLSMSVFGPGLYDFVVDIPQGQTIHLNRNLSVAHHLNLVSGRISTTAEVAIAGGGAIIGANDTNYIVTMGYGPLYNGSLRMFVPVNTAYWVEFPIGTWNEYAPIHLQNSSPAIPGYVRASVFEGVYDLGDTGIDISANSSVVNKSWLVERDTFAVLLNTRAGWLAGSEVNGFDRNNAYTMNYYNNMWDTYTAGAAVSGMYNTYTLDRLALPNGGFIAVVDTNLGLTVPEVPIGTTNIYPNPARDQLYIEFPNPNGDDIVYELYDATGRLIMNTKNSDSRTMIDFSKYENGVYTLRIINMTTSEVTVRPVVKS